MLITTYHNKKPFTVTVPNGNYSLGTLTQHLVNNLLDISFNVSDSQICSITNHQSTPITIQWFETSAFRGSAKEQLGWVLGFRKGSYTIAPKTTLIAENAANINTVRYVYLLLDDFNNGMQTTFVSPLTQNVLTQKILCRIQVINSILSPFGSVLDGNDFAGNMHSDTRSYTGKVDIQRFKISLINEWGRAIDLNGLDYSFLLELECT